mgnify:CR=1 FL=1|tara:strand:+ start:300 stop:608 length:309 start_codon:yes stop_codon:yes gene_type:complete
MSLGEDGIIQDKTIYGTGQDESAISWIGAGKTIDYHSVQKLRNELTKSFCRNNTDSWLCYFGDYLVMLLIVGVGGLILYLFIIVITSFTKKNFLKSLSKIKK